MRLKLPAMPARRNNEREWLLNYRKSNDNKSEWERSPEGQMQVALVREIMERQIELRQMVEAIGQ